MSLISWISLFDFARTQDQTPGENGSSPADPIEAISETTAQATEAASEFLGWIGSGELSALIALGLVILFTTVQWLARWAILKGIVQLPRADDYSFAALFHRIVKQFHIYFMIMISFAVTDAMLGLPNAVSVIVKIFFVLAAMAQAGELLVQVSHAAINPIDWKLFAVVV